MNFKSNKSKIEIAKAYDSPSWWYNIRGFFIFKLAYRSSLISLISFFYKHTSNNHLEIAVGSGIILKVILAIKKHLNKEDFFIVAFDYAWPMLCGSIKNFKNNSNIHLMQADVSEIPIKCNFFDSVSVANAMHCFPEIETAMNEINRILKPGGTLCANVLLHTRKKSFLNKISNAICIWGIKKGILYTPYHIDKIKDIIENSNFNIRYENISGNNYSFVASKN